MVQINTWLCIDFKKKKSKCTFKVSKLVTVKIPSLFGVCDALTSLGQLVH